jgi:hypothetical protein
MSTPNDVEIRSGYVFRALAKPGPLFYPRKISDPMVSPRPFPEIPQGDYKVVQVMISGKTGHPGISVIVERHIPDYFVVRWGNVKDPNDQGVIDDAENSLAVARETLGGLRQRLFFFRRFWS